MKLILPALAVALAITFAGAPAQAQTPADQAGQQACGNDAFALCGDAIPDRGRIEACLRKNYSRVSRPCKAYMASYSKTHGARSAHHYRKHHRVIRRHHTTRHKHHTTRRHYR